MLRIVTALGTIVLLFIFVGSGFAAADPPDKQSEKAPSEAALKRTRKMVNMLDEIYKTSIVLITDKYVNDDNDFPAGSAFVALFKSMDQKGYHKVRLIDLTGEPFEEANVAEDEFEKEGGKQLKSGKAYVEKIIYKKGKPYLRAMTPVPVVMQKCVMCHPHYADVKKGVPIGAMTYTVPID
ncbi:MAG TPA: hypothetical protein DIT97_05700 [Gimesia maris]|uniref:Tll0287-like domain-containing protein n=1 Tax=Gimesia maris TaxID=122 RepID=A0A3D3R1U9_9PLAN|nr:hypothetical protein [Gimesia maris]|tara:strand:+ start:20444 stop:20986 length:543 start_codon:yes stop_codon:yes gene_type:complete